MTPCPRCRVPDLVRLSNESEYGRDGGGRR